MYLNFQRHPSVIAPLKAGYETMKDPVIASTEIRFWRLYYVPVCAFPDLQPVCFTVGQ